MYAMWEGVQGLNEEYPMLLLWGSPPLWKFPPHRNRANFLFFFPTQPLHRLFQRNFRPLRSPLLIFDRLVILLSYFFEFLRFSERDCSKISRIKDFSWIPWIARVRWGGFLSFSSIEIHLRHRVSIVSCTFAFNFLKVPKICPTLFLLQGVKNPSFAFLRSAISPSKLPIRKRSKNDLFLPFCLRSRRLSMLLSNEAVYFVRDMSKSANKPRTYLYPCHWG